MDNSNSKIFVFKPAYQTTNLGDLLINKLIIEKLVKYGEVVVDDRGKSSQFISELIDSDRISRLTDITDGSPYSFLLGKATKGKEKYFVFPPGHTSRKGLKGAKIATKLLSLLLLLKIANVKIVRFGFSVGPFDPLNAYIEKMISKLFYFYGLRDSLSVNLAQKNGFRNFRHFPDLAWSLSIKAKTLKNPSVPKIAVISFRSSAYGTENNSKQIEGLVKSLNSVANVLAQFDKLIFSFQVESDEEPSRHLFKQVNHANKEIIPECLTLDQAKKLYQQSSLVLSNRLHVLLLAGQQNALPVAFIDVEKNAKITGIYKDNGLEKLIISSDQDPTSLVDNLERTLESADDLQQKFRLVAEDNNNKIDVLLKNFFE